jgi:hypothetical protein
VVSVGRVVGPAVLGDAVSVGRYVIAMLLATIALVPVGGGARALRRRMLPGWSGPPGLLADIVIGLGVVVGVSQLLGAVGWYRLAPITAGLAASGVAVWYLARLRPIERGLDRPAPVPVMAAAPDNRGAVVVALIATAVVVAGWSTQTVAALRHGPSGFDTSWYHLPVAARFVQEGSITSVHYLDSDGLTAFFPANSSLLHGLGIMLLGNDLLAPFLNMAFLALALLAAWCIGRPFGVGPATLAALVVVMGTPMLVGTQPGTAYNDTVGVALFLAAAALFLTGNPTRGSPSFAVLALAALAAGLALGTKFQFIIPVAALTVGVVALAPRGERLRRGALWVLILALAGGFWYARNLVAVGNPLPLVGLDLGPLELKGIPLAGSDSSLTEYLLDGRDWSQYLLPGLRSALGPAWWALLALSFAGLVLGLFARRGSTHRVLVLVGIVAVVGFVVTPAAHGASGAPFFFAYTLRYSALGLALGLVLLPLAVPRSWSMWWALAPCSLVVAATQLDPSIWPTELRTERFGAPIRGRESLAGVAVGATVLLLGAAAILVRRRGWRWQALVRRRSAMVAGVATGLALLATGFGLQQLYLRDRYVNAAPMPKIYEWARDVHDERIAVVGTDLQYPLYGKDLSNHVQYVGEPRPHGAFSPFRDCPSWRRALNAGHYSYVVISTRRDNASGQPQREDVWTSADPAIEVVQRENARAIFRGNERISLYRVKGHLDPSECDSLAAGR